MLVLYVVVWQGLNIYKKIVRWETFWDSVKLAWDWNFVDALGPTDAIKTKPKSNTAHSSS